MSNFVHRAPLFAALAVVACAGLARPLAAQTFVFSNDCGSGSWGSSCSIGGGLWRSNWGRTGPNPAALIPGAADTCLLSGLVTLDVSATVTGITVPAGATLSWLGTNLSVGSLSNSGAVSLTGAGNRFLSGSATNNPGSEWTVSGNSCYFSGLATLTNGGTITLTSGGAFRRNGGAIAQDVLVNTGLLRATGSGGAVVDLTLSSSPSGQWHSDTGAVLTFSGNAMSGTFVGDFDGSSDTVGNVTLAGDTTLISTPTSSPWGWSSASLATGAFTFSNQGRIQIVGPANRFFSGSAVNGPSGAIDLSQGAFYFNPGVPPTTLNNSGLITIGLNASFNRNGGALDGAVLSSSGTVRATQAGASIQNLTVISSGGVWASDAGASIDLVNGALGGTFVGSFTGDAFMDGTISLAANTSFSTLPATANPWSWMNATLITGLFTFTNSGWLETTSPANKFFSGNFVNAPGAAWDHAQGSLYFNPGTPPTTLANNGLLTFGLNAAFRRNGGAIGGAVFSNTGTVRALQAGGSVSDVTINSLNGVWTTDADAQLDLTSDNLAGTFIGEHAGTGSLSGNVGLVGNTVFSTTPASANPWKWTNGTVSTGAFTLTNTGRFETTSSSNKLFNGAAVNAAGATWTMSQGNFFFTPAGGSAVMTNSGTLLLGGGTNIFRSGGVLSGTLLSNAGVVSAIGPGATVHDIVLESTNGIWRTLAGTSLGFDGTSLRGTFVFDNAGSTTNSGGMALTGDTVFTTAPGSPNPFQWTAANIDAAGFTLTNTGRIETTSGFNKFLAGNVVNAAGAQWTCTQGALYFSQSSAGATRLTNNGTFTLASGTGLPRNGGLQSNAVFDNFGLFHITGAGSTVGDLTVINNPGGVIRIEPSSTLTLPADWTMSGGRLEGLGSFIVPGNTGLRNTGGTVAPGLAGSTGVLSSVQRFRQDAGGTLEIALINNGVQQTASRLSLTSGGFYGQAVLGGTLRVTLPAGTTPPPLGGTSYIIVDAPGGLTGAFGSIVDADPITDYRYTVTYTATQATLHVVHRCGSADVGSTGADTNFDGVLDNNDFVVFIDLFFSQSPVADVGSTGGVPGPDGAWDNNDFVVYIDMFFSGC